MNAAERALKRIEGVAEILRRHPPIDVGPDHPHRSSAHIAQSCANILKEEIAKDAVECHPVREAVNEHSVPRGEFGIPVPGFEKSPAGIAQEFCFYQSPKKERNGEYGIADEIKAMVEAGWNLNDIIAEVQKSGKDRDRSEFWWQLKSRMEKQRNKPDLFAGLR